MCSNIILFQFNLQYLDALAQQRLCNNVRDELDSFLKGLNGIIPDNLLSIFDENELEVRTFFTVKAMFALHFRTVFFLFSVIALRYG